jgi:hypothetical protein
MATGSQLLKELINALHLGTAEAAERALALATPATLKTLRDNKFREWDTTRELYGYVDEISAINEAILLVRLIAAEPGHAEQLLAGTQEDERLMEALQQQIPRMRMSEPITRGPPSERPATRLTLVHGGAVVCFDDQDQVARCPSEVIEQARDANPDAYDINDLEAQNPDDEDYRNPAVLADIYQDAVSEAIGNIPGSVQDIPTFLAGRDERRRKREEWEAGAPAREAARLERLARQGGANGSRLGRR